jgi:hypothetical protein
MVLFSNTLFAIPVTESGMVASDEPDSLSITAVITSLTIVYN